jgi:hypothetical protein
VPTHVDIDVEGATDVMACTEYANEIFLHLRNTEVRRRAMPAATGAAAEHGPALRSAPAILPS